MWQSQSLSLPLLLRLPYPLVGLTKHQCQTYCVPVPSMWLTSTHFILPAMCSRQRLFLLMFFEKEGGNWGLRWLDNVCPDPGIASIWIQAVWPQSLPSSGVCVCVWERDRESGREGEERQVTSQSQGHLTQWVAGQGDFKCWAQPLCPAAPNSLPAPLQSPNSFSIPLPVFTLCYPPAFDLGLLWDRK